MLGLQVRSGLWVPHPQDATVPRGLAALWDSCVTSRPHSALLPGCSPRGGLGGPSLWAGALCSVTWLYQACSTPVHAAVEGQSWDDREVPARGRLLQMGPGPVPLPPAAGMLGAPALGNCPSHPAPGARPWPLRGSRVQRLKSVVLAAVRQSLVFLASGTRDIFSVAASGLRPFRSLGRGQGSREGSGPWALGWPGQKPVASRESGVPWGL